MSESGLHETISGAAVSLELLRSRWRTWRRRSAREWFWALRRRLRPDSRCRAPFDSDLRIEVCLSDELALHYLLRREFEADVCDFVRRYLRPGMVFFDVGANIGQYTLLAAKRVGGTGSVHSFEPAPLECFKLRRNVNLNGFENVVINQTAVCDTDGDVQLQICGHGLGVYNSIGRPLASGNSATVDVPSVALDTYAQSSAIGKIDLLKLDIEGAELAAITGASKLLSSQDAPAIICEFSDQTASGMGHSTKDLRYLLEQFGYRLYRYDLACHRLIAEPRRDLYEYDNLICCKNSDLLQGLLTEDYCGTNRLGSRVPSSLDMESR